MTSEERAQKSRSFRWETSGDIAKCQLFSRLHKAKTFEMCLCLLFGNRHSLKQTDLNLLSFISYQLIMCSSLIIDKIAHVNSWTCFSVFIFVLYLTCDSWYVVFLTLSLAIWESSASSLAPMFFWFWWWFCRFSRDCNRESACTRSLVFVWFSWWFCWFAGDFNRESACTCSLVFVWFWWWFCWFAGDFNRESACTGSLVFVWFWWWFYWFAWTCNRESTPTKASVFTAVYWRFAFVFEGESPSPPCKVWCGGFTAWTCKKKKIEITVKPSQAYPPRFY